MRSVGELQREFVFSGRKLNHGFRLAFAKVQILRRLIDRHDFTARYVFRIDQQMMMAGIGAHITERFHCHAFDAHHHFEFLPNIGIVFRFDKKYAGF